MIAGPRHRGTSRGTPTRDDRADLDDCVSVEHRVGGNERAVLDHEVALAIEVESREKFADGHRAVELEFPRRVAEQDLHAGDAPFDFGALVGDSRWVITNDCPGRSA